MNNNFLEMAMVKKRTETRVYTSHVATLHKSFDKISSTYVGR